MDFMLISAKYEGDVVLPAEALNQCRKYKKIALFASVQFTGSLEKVIESLEEIGVMVISSKPDRTHEHHQLLGCNVFPKSLNLRQEPDAYLYIGDGAFHPSALFFSQKDSDDYKPVIKFNPLSKKTSVLKKSDFERNLRKYKASLMKFLTAENIGVLISTKPGQQHLKQAFKLKDHYKDKNFYFFAENNFGYSEFENFNFIDVWVNTACPRIGYDDAVNMSVPLININDAFQAREILSKKSLLNS